MPYFWWLRLKLSYNISKNPLRRFIEVQKHIEFHLPHYVILKLISLPTNLFHYPTQQYSVFNETYTRLKSMIQRFHIVFLKLKAVRARNPQAMQQNKYGLNWANSALLPRWWIPCPYSHYFEMKWFEISEVKFSILWKYNW